MARPLRLSTARESPQLAIHTRCVPTRATTAVLPTSPAVLSPLNSSSVLRKALRSACSIMQLMLL
jgi:hypothetical protein